MSAPRQRQDYRAALAAVRQLPGVDPERIVLWGISYSGGHVVRVAAEDGRVAAVIALTPALDGVAVLAHLARTVGIRQLLRTAAHGMRDALRAMTRRTPHLVPMVGEPGSRAIFAMEGAEQDYTEVASRAGTTRCARVRRSRWRSIGRSGSRRVSAARCSCRPAPQTASPRSPPPVEQPPEPAVRAEIREYPIDHVDVYTEAVYQRLLEDQLGFLAATCRPARRGGPRTPQRIGVASERREPTRCQ